MEGELLKRLLADPARWPFYLLLACGVIFIVKVINVIAEKFAKHLSEKMREKKGLLSFFKAAAQIFAIALVIYIANAIYWSQVANQIIPSPSKKPINTCSATVEMVITSEDKGQWHFADRGGYLIFGSNDHELLVASSEDSWGRPVAINEYLYRGVFQMDAMDSAVGKPVEMLKEADYVQVTFHKMPPEAVLVRGTAICLINSELRFELTFPKQKAKEKKLFLRDLDSFRKGLK